MEMTRSVDKSRPYSKLQYKRQLFFFDFFGWKCKRRMENCPWKTMTLYWKMAIYFALRGTGRHRRLTGTLLTIRIGACLSNDGGIRMMPDMATHTSTRNLGAKLLEEARRLSTARTCRSFKLLDSCMPRRIMQRVARRNGPLALCCCVCGFGEG